MKILNIIKSLIPRFKPMIIRTFQSQADARQAENVYKFTKIVDKYPHGLNGEQLESLCNTLHDAAEQVLIHQIERI